MFAALPADVVVARITDVPRERKDDIPALAAFFIRRFSGELKKKIDGLEPEAQKLLLRYNWPGNIANSRTRSSGPCC